MAFPTISNRRLLLPLVLALMLVGETAGLAVASRATSVPSPAPAAVTAPPNRSQAGASTRSEAAAPRAQTHSRPSLDRAATARPDLAAVAQASTVLAPSRSTPSVSGSYKGRNHIWIPSLGVSRPIAAFSCSRSEPPGNYVYRWGCAGRNNVYLMGHAYSVFKPLHDAYVSGRLRKGMTVVYADGNGHVRTYSVAWWKVTKPTTSASWAWAAQSRPSMTLQTCVGANGELRLMVRLVATD